MSNNSLKNILDKNIENHKNDIKKIAKSALLEKIEIKPSQKLKRWTSAQNHFEHKIDNLSHEESFNNRMLMFTLGPDIGTQKNQKLKPVNKTKKLRAMNSNCILKDLTKSIPFSDSPNLSEKIININRSPEKYSFASPRYLCRDIKESDTENQSNIIDLVPHYIHPRYKTQYQQLLRFRNENIREDDQKEQNLISGTNLIYHLEKRLQKKLKAIGKVGKSPNFVRLEIFIDILNDLISESWMFAPILIRIKSAYDDEVSRVLELPIIEKDLLQSQLEQLQTSIYQKEKLGNLQSESIQLEEAINSFLQSEDECHNLLIEEEIKLEQLIKEKAAFDEEKKKEYKMMAVEIIPTETEKLEILKSQCWDLMDEISKIQKETHKEMTPRATITHLSEGLQDIVIEIEKLKYHKRQLLSETEEMKIELDEYVIEDEMRDSDFRLIESILNTPSPKSFNDYKESNKWSWYIS